MKREGEEKWKEREERERVRDTQCLCVRGIERNMAKEVDKERK